MGYTLRTCRPEPEDILAALNRRTREKTSEGKWTIDWAAECITHERLSSERALSLSLTYLLACSMRSDNRARSLDSGEES